MSFYRLTELLYDMGVNWFGWKCFRYVYLASVISSKDRESIEVGYQEVHGGSTNARRPLLVEKNQIYPSPNPQLL